MRRYEIVEEINQMEYWFFAFICPLHIVQIILRQMKFILISTAWVLSEREQTQGKITSIPNSSSWTIQLYTRSKKYELSRTCWTLPSHSLISSNSIALALVYDRLMESQNWKDWRFQWRSLHCKNQSLYWTQGNVCTNSSFL